jgi:hypothetical protein
MENTTSTPKTSLDDLDLDLLGLLKPPRHLYFRIFEAPNLRPPVFEEMLPDLQRVIASIARKYQDPSHPSLAYEELLSEGNVKLAELLSKGYMTNGKCPTRQDFFCLFKTAFQNHVRSLVQKYCFTAKRTGVKPLERNRFEACEDPDDFEAVEIGNGSAETSRVVEYSLDDENYGLQVADEHCADPSHTIRDEADIQWNFGTLSEEYARLLTPVEKLVFHEMIYPSAHARCYAEMDALRGHDASRITVKIRFSHMAQALGMTPELFEEAVLSIRKKIQQYRERENLKSENSMDEVRYNALLAQLKKVFGLQIPEDIDPLVVRRMLTLAARDQYDKLTPQVKEMLLEIGAKVPTLVGNRLTCYGILYQRNSRACITCDLRQSCCAEAANLGLSEMVISPKLLGSKQPRIPVYLPKEAGAEGGAETSELKITTSDEAQIIALLDETFHKSVRNDQTFYYMLVGTERKRRNVFCIEHRSPLQLRVCSPSPELRQRLQGKRKSWFVRPEATYQEIVSIIEQHGNEAFSESSPDEETQEIIN